jgi:hypothetical protein
MSTNNTNPNHFPIISTDYAGRQCVLRTPSGVSVGVGHIATSFRGEKYIVVNGTAPHKASSSGRVCVCPYGANPKDPRNTDEFFPTVFDLVWVPVNDPQRVAA